jgi:3-isopropylmalate/(R)-2-methylmalate dehydratase small subunit
MAGLTTLRSASIVLDAPNIDTDRIIPARFLSTTTREGLGAHAFADWRTRPDGTPDPAFPLNDPANAGRQVLLAGPNFACGSSREHAPWALLDAGIRAVVSSGIADIFRANALKNGLLPIVLDEAVVRGLMARPDDVLAIDVAAGTLATPGGAVHAFALDAFARTCLLEGVDELGWLLARADAIAAHEARHAPRPFPHARHEDPAHAR